MKVKLFTAVLALQTAWILGTSFVQERGLASGTLVTLETRPVDPRDLLRGDYVTLNYKISDIPLTAFAPQTNTPAPGSTVYVAIESRGEFYEVARASSEPILAESGQVLLRGIAQGGWNPSSAHVAYGIERYYVPEGAGNPRGKLTVQVAVPSSGRAQIKNVFIDGKPFADAMKATAP